MARQHYAVIGAGAGGLCAAKNLRAAGIDVTIFEAGSRIGGLWVYENDSGMSSAYRSLHINSEARVSSFNDFPFPDDAPLYPNTAHMERYFTDYAHHFKLAELIRFKHRVTTIERDGAGYVVTTDAGGAECFDAVVVASGHQSAPRHPPQVEGFSGRYLHANAYRVPDPFAGENVLVIGPGNSGVDIAADVCSVTKMTYLSARNPVLIMPRLMFGAPNSRTLLKFERPFLPWKIRIWIRTRLTQIFHGRMEQWGFRTPRGRTHPISHPTLIAMIAWDRVRAKPGITSIKDKTVTFADGTVEQIDTIIAATGYETVLPFLPEAMTPMNGYQIELYNRVAHKDMPGLFFIGFFDATGGSNIRMMDDQAEYIAAIASGAVALPARDAMIEAIEDDKAYQRQQFPDSPRYGLELDPIRYRRKLAESYKANGLAPPRRVPLQSRSQLKTASS